MEYSILRTCVPRVRGVYTASRLSAPMERSWPNPIIITPGSRESSRAKRDSKRSSSADPHARVLMRRRRQRRKRRNGFRHPCPPATRREACDRRSRGRTSGAHREVASRPRGRPGAASRVSRTPRAASGVEIRGWGGERSGVAAAHHAPACARLFPVPLPARRLQRAIRSVVRRQRRIDTSGKALGRCSHLLGSAPAHPRLEATVPVAAVLSSHGEAARRRRLRALLAFARHVRVRSECALAAGCTKLMFSRLPSERSL